MRQMGDGRGPRRCPVRHDPGKLKPLASKGVNKRWGLPPDEGFTAIPHVVGKMLVAAKVTPGAFLTLYGVLCVWDWRSDGGVRQQISISGLAVLTGRTRHAVRGALRELEAKGFLFVEYGNAKEQATWVDITPVRQKAIAAANNLNPNGSGVGSVPAHTVNPNGPATTIEGGAGPRMTSRWTKDAQVPEPRMTSNLNQGCPYVESSRVEEYPDASGVSVEPSPPASITAVIEKQRAIARGRAR